MSHTPETLAKLATDLVLRTKLPSGVRLVVVVTDEKEQFVGMATNTGALLTRGMLVGAAAAVPEQFPSKLPDSQH
jgi:hypothetical protein